MNMNNDFCTLGTPRACVLHFNTLRSRRLETTTLNELVLIRSPVGNDVMVHLSYGSKLSILD